MQEDKKVRWQESTKTTKRENNCKISFDQAGHKQAAKMQERKQVRNQENKLQERLQLRGQDCEQANRDNA